MKEDSRSAGSSPSLPLSSASHDRVTFTLLLSFYIDSSIFIMTHGEPPADQSTSTVADVPSNERGSESAPQATTVDVDTAAQEEKARVFNGVEQIMELFRRGDCTRFQASSLVLNELGTWAGAADEEKEKAFDLYLTEINSFFAHPDESLTREGSRSLGAPVGSKGRAKRIRDEVEDILEQVLKGGSEDEEDEPRVIRRRAREDEMPWYNNTTAPARRNSCIETCRTLLRFSEDLAGVKSFLRVANNRPDGIPSSQWDRLLRGESVDLNQILSYMHFVHLDEERKGRVGSTEVVFAVAESKRQVRTGAEWSSAFGRMSKAVVFLFPHRREELLEYAEYIEGLFSAKHAGAHSKVILYDQSVRNQVAGGQNTLLTDYHRFTSLSEAILHADGIEYKGKGKGPGKGREGSGKGEGSKKDICRRFNGQAGCRFTEEDCFYKHSCSVCGSGGHGKSSCTAERH